MLKSRGALHRVLQREAVMYIQQIKKYQIELTPKYKLDYCLGVLREVESGCCIKYREIFANIGSYNIWDLSDRFVLRFAKSIRRGRI